MQLGVNTWVWESPLTDATLPVIAAKAATMGFQALELPVENPGDWDPIDARRVLADHGLTPYVVGAMAPGRELASADEATIDATVDYLTHCVDVAATLGAGVVAGPFYTSTGRTWRMSPEERQRVIDELRHNLARVVHHAAAHDVVVAIEPLNRYETSLINTVAQGLDALRPLLGPHLGLAVDTYHVNIEEQDIAAALTAAGSHVVHVQVCGNDRGPTGDDHFDWDVFLDALHAIDYRGPLNLESFTAANETIATAASIWRPLAASQDELASRSFDHLTRLLAERHAR